MSKPREPKRPRTHTIIKRGRGQMLTEYFCTTCCKVIKTGDENKRCKGGQR